VRSWWALALFDKATAISKKTADTLVLITFIDFLLSYFLKLVVIDLYTEITDFRTVNEKISELNLVIVLCLLTRHLLESECQAVLLNKVLESKVVLVRKPSAYYIA
jgi:hypothetical protein